MELYSSRIPFVLSNRALPETFKLSVRIIFTITLTSQHYHIKKHSSNGWCCSIHSEVDETFHTK